MSNKQRKPPPPPSSRFRRNPIRDPIYNDPNHPDYIPRRPPPPDIRPISNNQTASAPSVHEALDQIIGSHMGCSEVLTFLTRHGCADLTSSLHRGSLTAYPVATGGLGDIYRGQLIDHTLVAIKTIRLYGEGHSHGKYNKRAAKEIYTWSKCSHPNVLKLLGLVVYRDCLAMISPWATNGNISSYLSNHQSADRCCLSISICAGLSYLHENNVVHGDLKGANVLIADDGTPMLTDFGNSSLHSTTLQFTQTLSQPGFSLRWTAPEILRGKSGHTTAGDVYSLGMTILEVLTSEVPFPKKTDLSLYGHIVIYKKLPVRPKTIVPERSILGNMLWSILTSCWSYEPQLRPDSRTVWDVLKPLTPDKLKEVEEVVESDAGADADADEMGEE